jgi:hypothetical protein
VSKKDTYEDFDPQNYWKEGEVMDDGAGSKSRMIYRDPKTGQLAQAGKSLYDQRPDVAAQRAYQTALESLQGNLNIRKKLASWDDSGFYNYARSKGFDPESQFNLMDLYSDLNFNDITNIDPSIFPYAVRELMGKGAQDWSMYTFHPQTAKLWRRFPEQTRRDLMRVLNNNAIWNDTIRNPDFQATWGDTSDLEQEIAALMSQGAPALRFDPQGQPLQQAEETAAVNFLQGSPLTQMQTAVQPWQATWSPNGMLGGSEAGALLPAQYQELLQRLSLGSNQQSNLGLISEVLNRLMTL